MSEDVTRAAGAAAAVSEDRLRKAEAYVEAEDGVVNRLVGWAGTLVTVDRGDDVAVSPLRRDRGRLAVHRLSHHHHPAAALRPRRLRADAVLPVVSDGGAVSQPHPLVGRRRRHRRRGDPDLRHRGRRGVHRPRHHADPSRRRARRRVHRAAARGDAAHHRLDRPVRGDGVHGLRLFRAVPAAALDAPRLRRRAARRPSLHHARGHFRHSGRRVVLAHHPVHDLRRVPAAFRRRQVLHRFLAWRSWATRPTAPAAPWCCRRSCSAVRPARASPPP